MNKTPLQYAKENKSIELEELLISKGADIIVFVIEGNSIIRVKSNFNKT